LPDKGKDVNVPAAPELLSARQELGSFIRNYARDGGRTLNMFLQQARMIYPSVNFYQLFDPEMQALFAEQINIAAQNIVSNKLKVLFEGNPDEGAKDHRHKNFILDFVFSRVLKKGKENKMMVDGGSIIKLVQFLDEQCFEIEQLYMLIYSEIVQMGKIQDIRAETRGAVGVGSANVVAEDFDFDSFFNDFFIPIIKNVREQKLSRSNLRLVDVTHVNPKGIAEAIVPDAASRPLAEKAAVMKTSGAEFIKQCRQYFNYVHMPQATLSDSEVMDLIGQHFGKAAEQIEYTIREALITRECEDPVLNDCAFMPEIIGCRDMQKLLNWLANPQSFGREFEQHQHVPYKLVGHQVRKMLEMMLFYRKHVFDDSYRNSPRNRMILEDHMSKMLNIRESEGKNIRFRIRALIEDEPNGNTPQYEVIYDDAALAKEPEEQFVAEENGKKYRYFPVEEKEFIEVTVDIPENKNGGVHTGKLLIYSGDGKLIHCKSEQSYLSSLLRGKEPTDVIRWSIVPLSKDANDALRDFLYENYSSGNRVIRDHYENRHISSKKDAKKSKASQQFSEARGYSSAMYATLAKRTDTDQIEHMHIEFETQIFDMDTMLISNLSDYTVTSHTKVYTPEREFDNLFRYFFPPIIYGRKFADYKLQGFNPGASAGASTSKVG
jgi:hypothetical protein